MHAVGVWRQRMDVQRRPVARATWLLGLRKRCALCHRRGGIGGIGCASSRRAAAAEDALDGGKRRRRRRRGSRWRGGRRRFSVPVCSGGPNSPSAFWLVVSFERCIFKLDSVSVGHLFQAAFGGFARGFKVLSLADRVFRFTVSSKDVGFHIYNSRCIVRPEFKAFFNLWNSGGPNWNYELRLFLQEENANWWFVNHNTYLDSSTTCVTILFRQIYLFINTLFFHH